MEALGTKFDMLRFFGNFDGIAKFVLVWKEEEMVMDEKVRVFIFVDGGGERGRGFLSFGTRLVHLIIHGKIFIICRKWTGLY